MQILLLQWLEAHGADPIPARCKASCLPITNVMLPIDSCSSVGDRTGGHQGVCIAQSCEQ